MNKSGKKHERGQSMVEFALSLPILILILSGIIDIGRVYFAYIYLEEAAAEAALYLSLNPTCIDNSSGVGTECDDPNNAEWRANNSGSKQGIAQYVIVHSPDTTGVEIGDVVTAEATMNFLFITPGIAAIVESTTGSDVLTLEVTANHIVLNE